MPTPLSSTLSTTSFSRSSISMLIAPPSKVYFTAFERRLLMTFSMLPRSTYTFITPLLLVTEREIFLSLTWNLYNDTIPLTKDTMSVLLQWICICFKSILRTSRIWFTSVSIRWAFLSIIPIYLWLSALSTFSFNFFNGPIIKVSGERISWVALMRNFIFCSSYCVLMRCCL